MTFEEYRRYDALGLAGLVQKKEIEASELLEIAIRRAEEVNPKINSLSQKLYELGRESLKNINLSSSFAGVPFLVKDLGIHVAGTALRTGCKAYHNFISKEDSIITQRLRKAGLLIFGKTATPEFGLTPYTEPEAYGITRNPWNLQHTCGGSSGGSAASVAAGIVPLASASDGGGSIRIPAANCGLFGLKPTRGRVTMGNQIGEMWAGAVVENCVSRSVRDSAAYMDAILGASPGDAYVISSPQKPYLEETTLDPGKLKIGWSIEHILGHPVDQECIRAVQHTVQLLKDLGHHTEETALPFPKEAYTEMFVTMLLGECAGDIAELEQYLGRKVKTSDIETNSYALAMLGRTISAKDYVVQKRRWNEVNRQVALYHEQYDLLLTPVLSKPAIKIGELKNTASENRMLRIANRLGLGKLMLKMGALDQLAEKSFSYVAYTPLSNMTGQPAMSVPLHWSAQGLPVGVHFSGRLCEEDLLYRLAAQLEKAQPWFNKVALATEA